VDDRAGASDDENVAGRNVAPKASLGGETAE
jgi:hypothetical protein